MADPKPPDGKPDETMISFNELTLRPPSSSSDLDQVTLKASNTPQPAVSRSEKPTEPVSVAQARMDPERILNQYVLTDKLGAGGMGTVWKAHDRTLNRWVAVKFLNTTEDDAIRRFQREAQLAAQLRHPNISGIYEVNQARGRWYIAMEYIDGQSLDKTGMPLRALLAAFVKVCQALHVAHEKGIVHRDMKPGNVMVSKDGNPYVMDFGLAKETQSESSLSVSGSVMGTPAYMPPEQARGKLSAIDARSDVYSLGATLYAILTRKPPFEADNPMGILMKVCNEDPVPPSRHNAELPPGVEAIILKAMEKEKGRRYGTALALGEDLQRFLDDKEITAKPMSNLQRAFRKVRRNPWPYAAAMLLLLAGSVVTWLVVRPRPVQIVGNETPEQAWEREFNALKGDLAFQNTGRPAEDVLKKAVDLLAAMAPVHEQAARDFLETQTANLGEAPPKAEWLQSRETARRKSEWAAAIRALAAPRFPDLSARLASVEAALAPVVAYRGKMALKVFVWPHAEIRTLKVGHAMIVEGGKLGAQADARVPAGALQTPIVIEDLDVGDATLVLASAGKEKTFTFSAEKCENGGTYLFSGTMESMRLK